MADGSSNSIKNLCVFCGASKGVDPIYMQSANDLGKQMTAEGIRLVYGGGTVGLMGEIARTVFAGLGKEGVFGVIPEKLAPREVSGEMIGTVKVVNDMHERKKLMADSADAFVALPGGFGTLEELLEVVTWQQLGYHTKPVGVLNVGGFFDQLLSFFGHCVGEGFIAAKYNNVIVSSDPAELLQKLRQFKAPASLVEEAAKQGISQKDL